MAFQLDDLLRDDKKDANLIPDLSKATCNSQEEFRRLLERCPEYKIRSEKVGYRNPFLGFASSSEELIWKN